jgi:hypothetical protein
VWVGCVGGVCGWEGGGTDLFVDAQDALCVHVSVVAAPVSCVVAVRDVLERGGGGSQALMTT